MTVLTNSTSNTQTIQMSASVEWQPSSQTTNVPTEKIYQLLPHRYPFALVDRIIAYTPGQQAIGLKNVTINEPFFQGHFPDYPIMPGVLIVEAMAQVGGFVVAQMPGMDTGLFVFAGINKARFRRPVRPGDQLLITAELIQIRGNQFGKMQALAEVDRQLVAESELLFSVIEKSSI